jgi:hypothetical protein
LRIPSDFKKIYREKLATDRALNIAKALALALRSKEDHTSLLHSELIRGLEGSNQT